MSIADRRTCMRSWRVVVAGALVLAGCGGPSSDGAVGSTIEPVEPTGAPPVTRAVEPPQAGVDMTQMTTVDAVDAVGLVCPDSVPVDMSATDSSLTFEEQSRLEPMLSAVLQYGTEHPDQFGGYGLHWHDAGDASVFVSFTGDVASHRDALVERVEFPDELIVCQAAASEADLDAIAAALVDELHGRFTSIGSGGDGAVTVTLNANESDLAAELVERYGTSVDVNVGALDDPLQDADVVCPPTLDANLIDGLDVTIVDAGTQLVPTASGTVPVRVRLTNTSDDLIRFGSGHPTAAITDASSTPRTLDTRLVADEGIEISIEPGAHRDFDVDVSLASCDPADGYLVRAGRHFVVVSIYNSQLETDMSSGPLAITIAD
jgi:hypothetical protein